jgi:hypothetical protein
VAASVFPFRGGNRSDMSFDLGIGNHDATSDMNDPANHATLATYLPEGDHIVVGGLEDLMGDFEDHPYVSGISHLGATMSLNSAHSNPCLGEGHRHFTMPSPVVLDSSHACEDNEAKFADQQAKGKVQGNLGLPALDIDYFLQAGSPTALFVNDSPQLTSPQSTLISPNLVSDHQQMLSDHGHLSPSDAKGDILFQSSSLIDPNSPGIRAIRPVQTGDVVHKVAAGSNLGLSAADAQQRQHLPPHVYQLPQIDPSAAISFSMLCQDAIAHPHVFTQPPPKLQYRSHIQSRDPSLDAPAAGPNCTPSEQLHIRNPVTIATHVSGYSNSQAKLSSYNRRGHNAKIRTSGADVFRGRVAGYGNESTRTSRVEHNTCGVPMFDAESTAAIAHMEESFESSTSTIEPDGLARMLESLNYWVPQALPTKTVRRVASGDFPPPGATTAQDIVQPQEQEHKQTTGPPLSKTPASRFCHVCTRSVNSVSVAYCCNIAKGSCRKIICSKCAKEYGWQDVLDAIASPFIAATWACVHCREICPSRAQCATYKRINFQRRLRGKKRKMLKEAAIAAAREVAVMAGSSIDDFSRIGHGDDLMYKYHAAATAAATTVAMNMVASPGDKSAVCLIAPMTDDITILRSVEGLASGGVFSLDGGSELASRLEKFNKPVLRRSGGAVPAIKKLQDPKKCPTN